MKSSAISSSPPAVPPKSPLANLKRGLSVRERAQTIDSNSSLIKTRTGTPTRTTAATLTGSRSRSLSPSLSRKQSYVQPVGTSQRERQQQQQQQQQVVNQSKGAAQSRSSRQAVFCHVVVDDQLEIDDETGRVLWPQGPAHFLNAQERIQLLSHPGQYETASLPRSRSATPAAAKHGRVDYGAVRRSLQELWQTEESYLRKIQSLYNDFARPLRSFARVKSTALISPYAATQLFINIEELVPIAVAFERDLSEVANFVDKTKQGLPPRFGEMILHHVKRMQPFKRWLAGHTSADALRRELERSSAQFRQYIEAAQIGARESTRQTGGFTEMLAEPFQRVSRYRLMLDPIIAHLESDNENVEPLLEAVDLLSDICSMEVDDATRKAAALWSLMETIDGFPASLVGYDRSFITCIDVDELLDSNEVPSSLRGSTLRCSLFLFTDKILIAKRPSSSPSSFSSSTSSRAPQTGRHLAGLDNPDQLVSMYQSSQLMASSSLSASTSASGTPTHGIPSSPSKRSSSSLLPGSSRKTLGYRGVVDLVQLTLVESSSSATGFTLYLDEPPMDQSSDRWNGRRIRTYTVANNGVSSDESSRAKERDRFVAKLRQAQVEFVASAVDRGGSSGCGVSVWRSAGVRLASVTPTVADVYWIVSPKVEWSRRRTENRHNGAQVAMLLRESNGELKQEDDGNDAALTGSTCLRVVAQAHFVGPEQDKVSFSVLHLNSSSSRSSGRTSAADTIPIERIPAVIADLGSVSNLFRNTTSSSLASPISQHAVARSPGGGGWARPRSAIFSAALDVFAGAGSSLSSSLKRAHSQTSRTSGVSSSTVVTNQVHMYSQVHSRDSASPGARKLLAQKSAPNLWGASSGSATELAREVSARHHVDLDADVSITGSLIVPSHSPSTRSRHRRSSSLPAPPPSRYAAAAEEDSILQGLTDQDDCHAACPVQVASHSPQRGALQVTADDGQAGPSSVEYRTAPVSAPHAAPARRRMMGPRAPGMSPAGRVQASSEIHQFTNSNEMDSPYSSIQPLRDSTEMAIDSPVVASYSAGRGAANRAGSVSPRGEIATGSASKRPLEDSTRATPAKKTATPLAAAAFPNDSVSPGERYAVRSTSPTRTRRIVSGTLSAGGSKKGPLLASMAKNRDRVVSAASTIRGYSPPRPRPTKADEMDVFDDAPEVEESQSHALAVESSMQTRDVTPEVDMRDVDHPIELLRNHIRDLKTKMAFELPAGKENDRILSPSGLTRSPHTRNVSLKANSTPTSAFASSFVEGRKAGAVIDVPALLRWADQLSELVGKVEMQEQHSTARARSVSPLPPSAPSCAEFATLEQERDLLMAEIKTLKDDLSQVTEQDSQLRQALEGVTTENTTLRSAYQDLVGEINVLYDEFNQRLGQVVESVNTSSHTGDQSLVRARLQEAVLAQTAAERELATLKRDLREQLREKDLYEAILRQAGLLPGSSGSMVA